ncbi:MAG: response regulator [Prevotellaceae bacterium]|jgi:signal transduction histidine kinase/CheY-like chemotaxis protein/ligand-binding sensor domain-containing protein/AraC-like DNA-binding protein|nr:response regulator [Prevotellaceae bacterium]
MSKNPQFSSICSKNILRAIYIFFHITYFINNAGASDYHFKRISLEQGLSQPGVNSIIRDYNGILWIGTRQGLNSVDRNDLNTYFYKSNDNTSIPGNYIYNLNEDAQSNLWVVTDGGLSLYNRNKDNFETKITNRIQAIANVKDGVLFGGYMTVYYYSYKTKKIETLPFQNNDPDKNTSYKDYFITHLIPVNDTLVLAATEGDGVFTYNLKSYDFVPLITGDTSPLQSILYDKESNDIYLSVFQNGLYRYSLAGELKKHYTTKNTTLTNNIILDIKKRNGKIWMGTDGGGINILDVEKDIITNIEHIPGNINSLPVNSITVLYSDHNDSFWAGTVRDGVFLFKETYIKTYKDVTLGSNKGLSEKVVISLFEDKKKKLWIGTDGGGINKFDFETEEFTHYLNTYGDKVVSITDFSAAELLVSLYGKGVFTYNVNTQQYSPFIIIDNETNIKECFSGFVPICHKINAGKILILAKNAYLYDPQTCQFERLTYAEGITNLHSLQLVYSDNDKSFMTKGNAIYKLTHGENVIKRLVVLDENEYVNSVCYENNKNRLWIASTGGLSVYDIHAGKLEKVATNMFNRITYMCLDADNRLWINASNMLFSYDIKNEKIMIWDDSDGFSPNEVLTLYVKPSQSNYIYMGGSNGLVKIDKDINYDDNTPITFSLQNIELNGKIYMDSIFSKSHKKVPQNYSSLKIHVNLNEKDLFRRILFRYRINNQHHNSVVESYSNILSLPSLTPEKYNIYVSCMTKSGSWTEETPLITFEVMQLWYKRTGFIFTAICFVLGILALTMILLTKRNKQRLKWKMAMHQQELNEDKIRFLTNVSHELRTPLTLICAPLKRLLKNEKDEITNHPILRKQIKNVYHQANYMKGIINWILEYDRNTTLSDNLNMSLIDMNDLILKIISDFDTEFGEKQINIKLELDNQLRPTAMDDAKIRVVISNILMNTLKFSNADTDVIIRSQQKGDFLRVQVEDEGVGLKGVDTAMLFTRFYQGKHDRKGSGIGLAYCKELIEKHGGHIGAIDNEGSGAIVYFELPYKTTSDNIILNKFNDFKSYNNFFSQDDVAEEPDTSVYSVLIVDDNVEFQRYLESELHPLFKRVFKAKNGKEALNILKSNQPDILISDVMMPVMNGYQLCKEVKAKIDISHIPVILLTAKDDNESRKIGYKLGADFYLSKPFDIELLISVIRNQLKRKEIIKRKYQQETVPLSPEQATISNADEQFMIKLNKLIKENYSNPDFDISIIIDNLAMSRASLYSKMKYITGLGINDYINKCRIMAACSLLEKTDKSIADIAFETGFTSQRYFSIVFKQAMQKTPSNYRAENRK